METARLFQSGRSQAVRLPKEFRFTGTDVGVRHFGNGVLLLPLDNPWDTTATIEEMKLDMKQFDLKVIKYLDLFLAFSGTEKGRALAKIWDKNMKKLIDSGKLKALFEEYDMASVYHF